MHRGDGKSRSWNWASISRRIWPKSQTVNNYISGGVGGNGGRGGVQGGAGGAGEGPTLNYDINAGANFTMNNHDFQILHQSGETGIHILHRAVASEALYNSAESFPQPKCHPETRTNLLNKLFCWATASESDYSIQWLHGPAGAGKSAVMQSLCQELQDAGRLGGSFFFKRVHKTCGNAKVLFATLAFQLAISQSELKSLIARSVEKDPSVLARGMDVQLRSLILEPCKLLQNPTPSILLIDGLDECEGHHIQREILRLIASTVKDLGLRLRILIASRPEPHIRQTFEEKSFWGLVDFVNIEQSFEDVRTYLRAEFSRIRHEHRTTMGSIPTPWPSPRILETLVENSSGYFIYASTVIKFIDDEYSHPSKQLDMILVLHNTSSPFEPLDQLYLQILRGVPAKHHSSLCDILSVLVNYPGGIEVEEIDDLLDLEPGTVSLILRPLHSVLELRSERIWFVGIQVHHASFRDFLENQERSSIFYVGSPQHRAKEIRPIFISAGASQIKEGGLNMSLP
ncbi:hypothetical protein B0H14DRAFT_1176452 [Mycena olivaceomarginata]|nr:hypothetical protein B0H14DRAFT_1176452 [Mycena olivaceomarginata]